MIRTFNATGGSVVLAAAVALVAVPAPPPAKAVDPVTGGAVLLGGKILLGSILDDFDEKLQRLIDRAIQGQRLAVAQAGSELQLGIANLRVMLADLLKKTFDELTQQQQQLFHWLNKALDRIERMKDPFRAMSELNILDARVLVGKIQAAFGKEQEDFYISSIRGITLAFQENDYRVSVSGLGIGFAGNEPRCSVDILVDGEELDPFTIKQEENNRVDVRIPAQMLEKKFKTDKYGGAKFTVRSAITRKNEKTKTDETKVYSVTATLLLLPKAAGEVEVEEMIEKKGWGDKKETKSITLTRATPGERAERIEEWRCADNQTIVDVRYECNHPRSGWSYPLRKGGYGADFDVVEGGKKAVVYRVLASAQTTCFYHIDYVTETTTYETVSRGKVSLKFDEPFEVLLSPDNKGGNFKVSGKLFNGQKLLVTSGTGDTDKDNPLKIMGREKVGDRIKLTFRLNKID
jgi:hypothetical protein